MEKSLWHKNYFRKMDLNIVIKEQRTSNRRLAQWRVKWLIEHSTSHQLLWCIDSFVLRNPPLAILSNVGRHTKKKPPHGQAHLVFADTKANPEIRSIHEHR